ncbi:hypothetical protein AS593_06065 [Caulobacter vibrioides]|nr:hypothetical protein AS593_06065 [Caulobacter vibrioides]
MSIDRTDDERKRALAEEEEDFYRQEDARRRNEEEKAAARDTAIETMESWFFEQFEDPQLETPRDSEEQVFIYPWGGPFEANDVLHGVFGDRFDADWIDAAIDRIERDGTTEWAPSSSGDYYEHPEPDEMDGGGTPAELTASILQRLEALESIVAALPVAPSDLGHNGPPEDIGAPPYSNEDVKSVAAAITETRSVLGDPVPDPERLQALSVQFDTLGAKVRRYVAKKADLAIDEAVKASVKAVTWTAALGLLGTIAHELLVLATKLLAH